MSQREINRSLGGFVARIVTGRLRRVEKINICMKLTKMKF